MSMPFDPDFDDRSRRIYSGKPRYSICDYNYPAERICAPTKVPSAQLFDPVQTQPSPTASKASTTSGLKAYKTVLQPGTRPISEERLIKEVGGVYAGLVMVEKTCVEIEQQQMLESEREIWAGIARNWFTLQHNYHDSFLSSHHPSARHSLRKPSSKYAMPAQTRRHDTHPPLEFPRHRLPDPREREFYVPGTVEGVSVLATPDYGSGFNIVSEEFAAHHGLTINSDKTTSYGLPNGGSGAFVGTIHVEWSFLHEKETYGCVFHVMRNCICDMILGRDFLDGTDTLTRYAHNRIKVRYREHHSSSSIPRVFFVDQPSPSSRQRLLGKLDGHPIGGLTDTGSDLTIIRSSTAVQLAQKLGWKIDWDSRTEVQFVDGSTSFTRGVIRGVTWGFGADPGQQDTTPVDLHVMDHIPCALILDRSLLWDYQVFTRYAYCFIDIGSDNKAAVKTPTILWVRLKKRREPEPKKPDIAEEEARRRTRAVDEIEELPLHERAAALVEENHRIQQWEALHGSLGAGAASQNCFPTTNASANLSSTSSTTTHLTVTSPSSTDPSSSSSMVIGSPVGVHGAANGSTPPLPSSISGVGKKKKRPFLRFRRKRNIPSEFYG